MILGHRDIASHQPGEGLGGPDCRGCRAWSRAGDRPDGQSDAVRAALRVVRRAPGSGQERIFTGVILQTLWEALMAACIVIFLAALLVEVFARDLGVKRLSQTSAPTLTLQSALLGVAGALGVGVIAAMIPALPSSRPKCGLSENGSMARSTRRPVLLCWYQILVHASEGTIWHVTHPFPSGTTSLNSCSSRWHQAAMQPRATCSGPDFAN